MEPARARDARPLRRHGEDLVRHGDAVEEEKRPRDGPDVSDGLARRRRLVAVESPADEPHTRIRDRRQRGRHAGRAAAPHAARRVVKNSLPDIILAEKNWYLAVLADPADLHVACVKSTSKLGCRIDGAGRLN